MKIRLQFCVFVILLSFLGTYIEQTTIPNQQIVIQFSNADISSEDTENTIEIVKQQLQSIGVSKIEIGQQEDGKLKITYYSDADVERIQSILSKDNHFKFDHDSDSDNSNFPKNRNAKDFELNISEIQNSSPTNWDFEGVQIVEFNQKSDRFDHLKDNNSGQSFNNTKQSNSVVKVAIQVNTAVVIATGNIAYKIPEVRAGPSA